VFNRDGRRIVTVSSDNTFREWDGRPARPSHSRLPRSASSATRDHKDQTGRREMSVPVTSL